jgi:hypothetical protein
MANLTAVAQVYDNSGNAIAASQLGANNYKNAISTSDAGREFIVKIEADAATLTDAKLNEAIAYLTRNNYLSSNTDASTAGTIAAIGTSDGTAFDPAADTIVFVRLQTTDDFAVTDFNAAQTNTTLTVICEFKPAK